MTRSQVLKTFGLLVLTLCILGSCLPPAYAEEEATDVVTVKGQALRGKVAALGKKGIEFETIYGEGTITIPYDSVESLSTQSSLWILYEDDQIVRGKVLGLEAGELLVGDEVESATRVAVPSVRSAIPVEKYRKTWLTRLRAEYPEWKASADFGMAFEEGAVDKEKFAYGLYFERRKRPTTFTFDFRGAYEKQRVRNEPKETTKDEFRLLLEGSYDYTQRLFLYALPAVDRDAPRRISFRAFPAAGTGYRFFDQDNANVKLQGGLGYVYENFDELLPTNQYLALQVRGGGRYRFSNGVEFYLWALYMPSIVTFEGLTKNWLFRMESELLIPIYDPFALKFRTTNVNDRNPAPDVGNNKVTTTATFAVEF